MPEWIHLVLMGASMEAAKLAGAADRLAHFCTQAKAGIDAELKDLRAKMERMRRPSVVRPEKSWRLEPQANGGTALVLEESLPTQAGDARSISYWVVLPEPLGKSLTESTRRNRDVMVERLIGDGVRVHGLEDGL